MSDKNPESPQEPRRLPHAEPPQQVASGETNNTGPSYISKVWTNILIVLLFVVWAGPLGVLTVKSTIMLGLDAWMWIGGTVALYLGYFLAAPRIIVRAKASFSFFLNVVCAGLAYVLVMMMEGDTALKLFEMISNGIELLVNVPEVAEAAAEMIPEAAEAVKDVVPEAAEAVQDSTSAGSGS